MAGSTRLELAASAVTGRRSNQLNYDPASLRGYYRPRQAVGWNLQRLEAVVGSEGLEPPTSCL